MMKKLTALLLAGAMTLSLAACGGNTSSSGSSAASGSAPASSSTSTSTSASATASYEDLEPVSLILADSAAKGAAGSVFDELVAEKAAEITGGQLTIETFINGELGADTDLLR